MTTATTTQVQARPVQSVRAVAVVTLLFGFGLVFFTGFANSAAVHNAAHDTRHAMSFPCH